MSTQKWMIVPFHDRGSCHGPGYFRKLFMIIMEEDTGERPSRGRSCVSTTSRKGTVVVLWEESLCQSEVVDVALSG